MSFTRAAPALAGSRPARGCRSSCCDGLPVCAAQAPHRALELAGDRDSGAGGLTQEGRAVGAIPLNAGALGSRLLLVGSEDCTRGGAGEPRERRLPVFGHESRGSANLAPQPQRRPVRPSPWQAPSWPRSSWPPHARRRERRCCGASSWLFCEDAGEECQEISAESKI